MSSRPTVAVIGAGFSGLLTAVHLLVDPDGPDVHLIERRPKFGQGAAYSTGNPDHLLNVRAANMSAFAQWPTHFVEWLEASGSAATARTFVTRATYGDYLRDLLREALALPDAAGRLILEPDEAVGLTPVDRGWRVEMAMGRGFDADAAVLAIGNLPPHPPLPIDPAVASDRRYVADPWSLDPDAAPEAGLAILFGTGLTMVDVALTLASSRPDLKVLALSRRGLLPRRHLDGLAPAAGAKVKPQGSVAQALGAIRRQADARGWRETIDGLRPHVQSTWRGWSAEERRRFLRHGRPWWDVHRHRLAPRVADRLDGLIESGMLRIAAGQALSLTATPDGLQLDWRPRGGREPVRTLADLVVNCTGPTGNLQASADTLLGDLQRNGLIRADACGIGLDVDARSRVIDAQSRAAPSLFAVGPMTRGAFWEITSVPDIRIQSADAARRLLEALRSGRAVRRRAAVV